MTDVESALRRAKAHLVVADIDQPALDEAQCHHLAVVMRLRDGSPLTVTDGAGRWRQGRWNGDALVVDGPVIRDDRSRRPLTVGFAIPKQDRPEWIVQKLTELGVAEIVLIEAERSVVRWSGARAAKKVEKLQRTAIEAVQQSRGVWVPKVRGPIPAIDLLPHAYIAEPGAGPVPVPLTTALVGPEGGWTEAEVAAAQGAFDLGPSILRVETAALVVAALIRGATTS